MSALCAASGLLVSLGTASSVTSVAVAALGAWTASALVIFPSATVRRTWTGAVLGLRGVAGDGRRARLLPGAALRRLLGGRRLLRGACRRATAPAGPVDGFSDSSSTIPDTVAAVASTIRRMGWLFFIAP